MQSTLAAIGLLSPVKILLSNLMSLDMSMRRTSAGTLAPIEILMRSPDTSSDACNLIQQQDDEGSVGEEDIVSYVASR